LYENLFETESGNYHLSVLRSKNHLEEESEQMNHCVGTSDSYINKINKGEIEILSFRNKEGEPIITIEYNLKNGNIEQIKKESDEYLDFNDPYYKEFVESLQKMQETFVYDYDYDTGELIEKKKRKINKVNASELGNLKLEKDHLATGRGNISTKDFDPEIDFILKTGKITETPDEKLVEIINKIEGTNYKTEEIARTPEEITEDTRYYTGSLDERYVDLLNNRKNPLTIEGDIDFKGCTSLTSLPENITFKGEANFEGCTSLVFLSENILFEKYVFFKNCTSLKTLSKNIIFEKFVDFTGCTSLISLPENISFEGYVYFEGCTSLASLPENMFINNDANFEGCSSLTSLPEKMFINGDANFINCTSLTKEDIIKLRKMKEKWNIKGELIF